MRAEPKIGKPNHTYWAAHQSHLSGQVVPRQRCLGHTDGAVQWTGTCLQRMSSVSSSQVPPSFWSWTLVMYVVCLCVVSWVVVVVVMGVVSRVGCLSLPAFQVALHRVPLRAILCRGGKGRPGREIPVLSVGSVRLWVCVVNKLHPRNKDTSSQQQQCRWTVIHDRHNSNGRPQVSPCSRESSRHTPRQMDITHMRMKQGSDSTNLCASEGGSKKKTVPPTPNIEAPCRKEVVVIASKLRQKRGRRRHSDGFMSGDGFLHSSSGTSPRFMVGGMADFFLSGLVRSDAVAMLFRDHTGPNRWHSGSSRIRNWKHTTQVRWLVPKGHPSQVPQPPHNVTRTMDLASAHLASSPPKDRVKMHVSVVSRTIQSNLGCPQDDYDYRKCSVRITWQMCWRSTSRGSRGRHCAQFWVWR